MKKITLPIRSRHLLEWLHYDVATGDWSFLTNHGRALLFIAGDPNARLRDIAGALDITERTAFGIVVDLADAGYVVKEKDGRRNRYEIQGHLPLPETMSRQRTIGEVLDLLVAATPRRARK
jgi:DNA-binding IclR family transcriptional regulator